MAIPAMRRRFIYPSADLVTLDVNVDLAIDRLACALLATSPGVASGDMDANSSVVVLGFPRSGNTYLGAWMARVVMPGVRVIDGRATHSALDVHRYANSDVPVVVPVRNAIDTCASAMVRAGKFDNSHYGLQILRSYEAWYRVAAQAVERESVSVITFPQIVSGPRQALIDGPIGHLLDPDAAAAVDCRTFTTELRASLSGIPGQGADQDGVAARLMVSLPEPARARESSAAKALLGSSEFAGRLQRAERAHELLLRTAHQHGKLASNAGPVSVDSSGRS